MTSSGSAYARFRRALATGNLTLVRASAAELPRLSLPDALDVLALMAAHDDPAYGRAAVRFAGRVAAERPGVSLEDLAAVVLALASLPWDEAAAERLRTAAGRR